MVVVIFAALAYGAVTWISNGGGLPWSGAAPSPSTSSTPADGSTTSTTPSEAASGSTTEAPPPSETPTPEPNLASAVKVENATKTAGLAGGARDTLKAAGFTDVSIGNWSGAAVDSTVVFYPAAADLGTAAKVAELLGISRVVEDAAQAPDGVVVVLEADFTP